MRQPKAIMCRGDDGTDFSVTPEVPQLPDNVEDCGSELNNQHSLLLDRNASKLPKQIDPVYSGENADRKKMVVLNSRTDSSKEQWLPVAPTSFPLTEMARGETQKGSVVTYDDILTSLGEFGRHQKRLFLLLGLLFVTGSVQTLISVFTLAAPAHRCAIPDLANDSWSEHSDQHAVLISAFVPPGRKSTGYSFCELYTQGNFSYGSSEAATYGHGPTSGHAETNNSEVTSCERYVYDNSVYRSTIVTDMDLVCEKSLYISHLQMVLMVGSLVGSQLSGLLSDLWGRKPVMMLSLLVHILGTLTITWANSFALLMALMFFVGASVSGMLTPSFVMCQELVGPSKRKWTGYGLMAFWSVGMILLAPLAFCLRDWQHLQFTTSLLTLPFLSFWWFIPESPRWLISKGRTVEAETVMRRTAHVNGVTLPPDILNDVSLQDGASASFLQACSHFTLVVRSFIIFFVWFVNSLTYYGLSWNVGTLWGSVYVNFLLSGSVELVSFVFCILLLDRIGRRPVTCVLMMVAGCTCTATILPGLQTDPSLQWLTVSLALIGKMGIAGSFATIWVYSSELFPTVIRNSGMGSSSVCARIGGIIAPYIANMGKSSGDETPKAVPLVIFGVSSIIASMLLFLLPETVNRPLPETIEDAISMERRSRQARLSESPGKKGANSVQDRYCCA